MGHPDARRGRPCAPTLLAGTMRPQTRSQTDLAWRLRLLQVPWSPQLPLSHWAAGPDGMIALAVEGADDGGG